MVSPCLNPFFLLFLSFFHGSCSDEMKDEYLTKRFSDAELAAKIVAHYKRLPSLRILARQPVVCWMVATLFEFCFQSHGYGEHPPRLTPFYVNIMIFQTNRSLELYQKPQDSKVRPK